MVQALVFPIVPYGTETWTMRQAEMTKIDAFEMGRWRRLMRVTWKERKTNVLVLEKIKPEWTLVSRTRSDTATRRGIENDLMLGGN